MSSRLPTLSTEIINKDRGFRIFGEEELYSKKTRTGYVPNPTDLIRINETRSFQIVVSTDYTNLAWITEPFGESKNVDDDRPLGTHSPIKSDRYAVMVDTSKHPYTLVFHDGFVVKGPDAEGVRVFRGRDVTTNGEVLSAYYKGGKIISTLIPLNPITCNGEDTASMVPMAGACLSEVRDGEDISIVVYADDDHVKEIARGFIVKTNLVLASEAPARQVIDVRLKSPMLVDDASTQLSLPINMPIDDIPMWTEIVYSDGVKRLTIDGNRIALNGLRSAASHDTYYIASNEGQTLPLTLSYRMERNESYAGDNQRDGIIYRDYTAVTESPNGAYSVKLFVVPVWLDAARGWRLRYFLYNLTRGNVYEATAAVEHVEGSAPFDPLLYNINQRINVRVDISKVNPIYRPYIHPQSFQIALLGAGTNHSINYQIRYVHEGKIYKGVVGEFVYSNVTYTDLTIDGGISTLSEWLEELYYNAYPIYDRRTEDAAPTPTHYELIIEGKTYLYPIDNWNKKHVIDFRTVTASMCLIKWIRRTSTDTYHLGTSPIQIYQKVV